MTELPPPRSYASLWTWSGVRMSGLAMGAVICVAARMWLHFQVKDARVRSQVPAPDQVELRRLVKDPAQDEPRLWALFQKYYDIEHMLPGLRNPDWLALLIPMLWSVPFILILGFWGSRPLTRQFSVRAWAFNCQRHLRRARWQPSRPAKRRWWPPGCCFASKIASSRLYFWHPQLWNCVKDPNDPSGARRWEG